MVIKETHIFTRIIQSLMPDEIYRKLQEALINNPRCGDVIPGSGGLRKVRWNLSGRGKRGGIRVIYYYIEQNEQIYMIYSYKKNEQCDLSKDQLKQLKRVVEEELGK